jgi:hypothetical protein
MQVNTVTSLADRQDPGASRDRASFRDPSGFVFVRDGVVFRQVNLAYKDDFDLLVGSGLAAHLQDREMMVKTEEVSLGRPVAVDAALYKVLKPETIPFISYPYEWCFSQLRDAALLTLRLQVHALKYGMSLKDASAYNIQFFRGKPILIDTLSFERYVEGQPWVAYRQFCQHFLAPLALMAFCDVRLNQLAKVFIDGVPLDLAASLLPARTWLKPSLVAHVHLHARMQKKHSDAGRLPGRGGAGRPVSRRELVGILESIARTIQKLSYEPAGTEWAEYYSDTNYSTQSLDEKQRLVAELMQRVSPASVWDLGANTGRFSRLSSTRGIPTVAFDIDAAAVERNYREAKAHGETHLLPLVLDLSNPSPDLGWASQERRSIVARGPVDLALALALIHHLAIGNNVPLSQVAEFLAAIAKNLIIEFVPKGDSQVQRLLATRKDVFPEYTETHFRTAFERFFFIEDVVAIPNTSRVLYRMHVRHETV